MIHDHFGWRDCVLGENLETAITFLYPGFDQLNRIVIESSNSVILQAIRSRRNSNDFKVMLLSSDVVNLYDTHISVTRGYSEFEQGGHFCNLPQGLAPVVKGYYGA